MLLETLKRLYNYTSKLRQDYLINGMEDPTYNFWLGVSIGVKVAILAQTRPSLITGNSFHNILINVAKEQLDG